ncbi:MAG: hypothetical protein R2849_20065 [Thermomicrobiales bacterium]
MEQPEDIEWDWLDIDGDIGITARASTPDDVIQEVIDYLVERGFEPPEEGLRV